MIWQVSFLPNRIGLGVGVGVGSGLGSGSCSVADLNSAGVLSRCILVLVILVKLVSDDVRMTSCRLWGVSLAVPKRRSSSVLVVRSGGQRCVLKTDCAGPYLVMRYLTVQVWSGIGVTVE